MIAFKEVLETLLAALDRLEIDYLIGGSVASSLHGFPRQTNDIDLVAEFRGVDIHVFCEALARDFYIDPETVTSAIRQGRPFNIIHFKGGFKFDFFPSDASGFGRSELSRKRYVVGAIPGLESVQLPVSSIEDTILAKLVWFRKGGGVSDRQWYDILGMIKVQDARIDTSYVRDWAARLGVLDLWERARGGNTPA